MRATTASVNASVEAVAPSRQLRVVAMSFLFRPFLFGPFLFGPFLFGCGGAAVAVGQVLEGLTGGGDGARDVAAPVDPVDRHRALAAVAEAVRDARRHPGGLTGDEVELVVAHDRGGLALVDEDGLLHVVRVQRDAGAGREDGHAGRHLVRIAVPLADERHGDDAVAAVEGLDVGGAQDHRRRGGLGGLGCGAHADSSAVWLTSSAPGVFTWPTSTCSATVRHAAKCGDVLCAANASASR